MTVRIPVDNDKLADYCRQHHILKLSFFGSVLSSDFRPDSDVDVLVEFEQQHIPGFAFFTMEEELSKILKHKVDLHTPNFLSRYFRDQVISKAEVIYFG
ncbi:nucleotidyltransferase family protein [Candidatus Margulisiibacteriota bacterium]